MPQLPVHHTCSICLRRRSREFRRRHPATSDSQQLPGICRRCVPPKHLEVVHIHHHLYYYSPWTDGTNATAGRENPLCFESTISLETKKLTRTETIHELPGSSVETPEESPVVGPKPSWFER
ncbi:hypothetical protein BKA60DRAFT_547891 [Fusarium oxysporum]|nr:hypothetical protein BKA60DRAFT_547891 [Fusarium oxysporum]